jgi:hypothetical protein
MSTDKTFIKDDVVAEILNKAREDSEFKATLFSNPQQALDRFGVVIPGASGKNYQETVYAAIDRAEFYRWFNEKILNGLRDKTGSTAPGPCVTDSEHDDVDWDFEVTKYKP